MLKYAEVRERIKTGDLISCEGRGVSSYLIRLWTSSSISHCGIAVWAGDALWMLESMEPHGVRVRALSHIGEFKWLPLKMSETARGRVSKNALAHVGRIPYSKRGILLQILKPVFGKFADHLLEEGRTICSRYAAWHLRNSTVWNNGLRVPAAPTPAKLELWCERNMHDKARSDGSVRVSNPLPEPINLK